MKQQRVVSRQAATVMATLWALSGCGGQGSGGAGDANGSDASASDAATDTGVVDNDGAVGDAAAGGTDTAADAATTATPTWHGTVAPIVATRCGSCHIDGGVAPFALDSADAWADFGTIALASMTVGTMPPWPPAAECGSFAHSNVMPPAEIATVKAWLAAKRPLGDAATAAPLPKGPAKLDPTHVLPMPKPFTPKEGKNDQYRCFLLDLDTSEDLYVRGTQVIPGAKALVHHVLVYALEGDQVKKAEDADAKDETPGYTCFGGPLPSQGGGILGFSGGFPNQIASWVPGATPRLAMANAALRIKKGSRVVMQVHYNLSASAPVEDVTTLQLIADTTPPERLVVTRPLLIETLNIPAGADDVVHKRTYRYYGDAEVRIHALAPHMHMLGTRFEAKIVRKDGTEACALNIPHWDFAWQMAYARPKDDPIVLKNGDGIEMSCVYDNTVEHQPFVDGKQQTPRNVKWGDGSLDEMCMLYLDMSEPFVASKPAEAKACDGFDTCQATCGDSPSSCVFGCKSVEADCGTCAIGQIVGCAGAACAGSLLGAQKCLTTCMVGALMLDSNADACLSSECGSQWAKARACIDGKLSAGTCDAKLASCGLQFGPAK